MKNIPLAKVTRPKVTGIFPRERLFRLMDTGRSCPVLWITGPPGAGKTTLVTSYLDTRKLPCLWYQVDEGDADVATFFYYMGMAAKKAIPGKRKPSLPSLTPERLRTISAFTRKYFELLSSLKTPFVIVFDNYQDAPADSAFHEMFAQCLEIIPEGIQVVAISRMEPPAMTVRMAETLTGMDASGHILSRMNRNNYFTTARHQPERVYQYHPLFREFLLSRAKDTFTPEEFLAIQKNAAGILEETGHIEDAVIIFRDIGEWDSLVGLILKHAEFLVKHGRLKTLAEWLAGIPVETLENTPWLLYWSGICRLSDNPTESRTYFDRAFERFRSQGEQTGMWLSWSYAVDTFFHEFSNFSSLDRYISVFEELYQEGYVFSTPEVRFRTISCRFISMMLREPTTSNLCVC